MDAADEAMLRKFQKELNAGTVSLVLLAILDHSGEPLYGYQIAKSIEGAWGEGVPVKQGTLYPVLRSMEENGLLEQPSRAERFGPASEVLHDHRPGTRGPRRLESGVGPYARLRRRDTGGERWLTRSRDTSLNSERRFRAPTLHSCRTHSTTPRTTCAPRSPTLATRRDTGSASPRRSTPTARPRRSPSAYRDAELTVAAALRKPPVARPQSGFGASPLGRFFGIVMDPSAWGAFFYMFLALATGILYFTLVVTGISLTLGLLDPHHRRAAGAALPRHDPRDLARRGPDGRGPARRAHAEKAADRRRSGQPVGAHQELAHGLPHVDDDALHGAAAAARDHLLHRDGDGAVALGVGHRDSVRADAHERADHPRIPVRLLHRAVGDAAVRGRPACSASSRRCGSRRVWARCTACGRRRCSWAGSRADRAPEPPAYVGGAQS